ncbi:MAG TPA: TetR family transcriptional regulator [Microlunatus sp.]
MTKRPAGRRTPTPDARIRDAERTKSRLIDAAFDEFAAHGYAGARVRDIADRAGVNKQLISYYFGGKEGLFRALTQQWHWFEDELHDRSPTLAELAVGYLRRGLADPRGTRLSLWQAISEPSKAADPDDQQRAATDLERLRDRQLAGELPPDLDLASLQIAITGMVVAPVIFPDLVRDLTGDSADSEEFADRYADALTKIINRLRSDPDSPTSVDEKGHS